MKVVINYTVYLGKEDIDEYVKFMLTRHNQVTHELKYTLWKLSYGVHRNAERPHLHFHTINEICEGGKIYKGKGLVSKIKRTEAWRHPTVPYIPFEIPAIKMTVNYETGGDPRYPYDERKILAYPFKEYGNMDALEKDVDLEIICNLPFEGIAIRDIEPLRDYAHKLYIEAQANRDRVAKEEAKKKKDKNDLYSQLDKVIVTTNLYDKPNEMEYLMRYTQKQILMYYKENDKRFSIHQLKNTAANYLFFKDIVTADQIVDYVNR